MLRGATAPQSSFEGNAQSQGSKRKDTFLSRCTEVYGSKRWTPPALRAHVLTFTIFVCWALIAVLQYLLQKSQKNNGVIFAPKISDLPLKESFLYQYFPTMLAVLFSIYWTWIDVETKRMEPYYQLSKITGALGKDSLLLEYPFDFIPLVPIKALRDRHWPVFWASFAVVLVTLGLVPTQAGIFSVKTVSRSVDAPFTVLMSSIPVTEQATTLTFRYAQSTYGIVSLNETMPPFMAHNYTLRPFHISTDSEKLSKFTSRNGTWTAPTTMYYSDLYCQDVSHKADNSTRIVYTSDRGCKFDIGLTGNSTITPYDSKLQTAPVKQYTGMYVGYENGNFADYSLDYYCKATGNRTFYAAFQRNKKRDKDPPNDVTAVFCNSRYWQQEVTATVDMLTQRPLYVQPVGEKQALAWDMFNVTIFETLLNAATLGREVRADVLPAKNTPQYSGPVADMDLTWTSVQPMVGLAAIAGKQPLETYLDWQNLSRSYADAYRLMFARAMVEVLGDKATPAIQVNGKQQITTEAVVLEPVFVYIVEAFLAIISLSTMVLLFLSLTRKRNLCTDPATIASVMTLVANSQSLLSDFQSLDLCTAEEMRRFVGHKRYQLIEESSGPRIIEIDQPVIDYDENPSSRPIVHRGTDIADPVRPHEFKLWVGFLLTNLFLSLAIGLAIIFMKARSQGLPLPSSNTVVQNILENYIPTALATLIEPIWILINRLLCMLQPIEELQDCNARAQKSIDLGYSSLPPQLVFFKAMRAKHFVLAIVCIMALLANLLAVAFAGIFHQDSINVPYAARLSTPLDLKFVAINGSVGPPNLVGFSQSGAYRGGDGVDQFLIADSNVSRGTPLPAWSDEKFFYLPFLTNDSTTNTRGFEAATEAFGADLECSALEFGGSVKGELQPSSDAPSDALRPSINLTITKGSSRYECKSPDTYLRSGPIGLGCSGGPSAAELVILPHPTRFNASRAEVEACKELIVLGWIRTNNDCGKARTKAFAKENATFVQCKPRWLTGTAQVRVDESGRLLAKARNVDVRPITQENSTKYFTNDPVNLVGQSNMYLFQNLLSSWHNDSYADDFLNYFIAHTSNYSELLDPSQDVPSFEDVIGPLNKAYSGLFAIWLATNKDKLLVPRTGEQNSHTKGWRIQSETRLFVSTPMFIMSEIILCTYALITLLVYARRPGRYLPRLPTSIAAMIGLFAASSAIWDMKNTAHLDKKGRAHHLSRLDTRYGYGSYIGAGDGRVHIGIEKTPFVRRRPKSSWLEKRKNTARYNSSDEI